MLFIIASLAVVTVSSLYLLVCVDKHDTTCKGKLRDYVYRLPVRFRRLGRAYKCEFVYLGCERLALYLCFKKNPVLQCIYIILAVGGFLIYITDVWFDDEFA